MSSSCCAIEDDTSYPPRLPYKERVDAAAYISRRYSRHTLAPVLPHSRVSRMLPEPGHLLSRRESALSFPSSISLYVRRTSTLLITTLFSSSAISSVLLCQHLSFTIDIHQRNHVLEKYTRGYIAPRSNVTWPGHQVWHR